VEQFGLYRQFILYASFLQLVAAFSFAESLLYFLPAHATSPWRVVAQTNVLVLCSSGAIVLLLLVADALTPGGLVGTELLPLIAYIVLFVNLDFWEYYFLATHRPVAVFAYTASRLVARMTLVILLAYFTANVKVIIWSLVALEALRLCVSAAAWKMLSRRIAEPLLPRMWPEQLRYCVPTGLAMLLFMANRNLGGISVSKTIGASALAHYAIGTYADYIYLAVGSSIAAVLLPEMVRRHAKSKLHALDLWQKATVVNCMLLLPAAALLARFAEPIIITVFGERYRSSIPVLQIHMLFLVRACFDFSPALRAINKTRPLMYSNVAALVVNVIGLYILLPRFGIVGAVSALVLSSFAEATVLGWFTVSLYGSVVKDFVPWTRVGKVVAAVAVAGIIFALPFQNVGRGLVPVMAAAAVFYVAFALMLKMFQVSEAVTLWSQLRNSALFSMVRAK
jgi:O-antigen/teichoic acid export membrane protein